MAKIQPGIGFGSVAPETRDAVPVLIDRLNLPKSELKPDRNHRLSVQGWLTILVCAGAVLVYLSLAMQSLVVFLIGESICVVLAPFVMWGERRNIREWLAARGKCAGCGFNLRGVKGPCPQCDRKQFVD